MIYRGPKREIGDDIQWRRERAQYRIDFLRRRSGVKYWTIEEFVESLDPWIRAKWAMETLEREFNRVNSNIAGLLVKIETPHSARRSWWQFWRRRQNEKAT